MINIYIIITYFYTHVYIYIHIQYIYIYMHTFPRALRMLRRAGSPAYMPEINGSMMRENTSEPAYIHIYIHRYIR